jgi:hypothetical protein
MNTQWVAPIIDVEGPFLQGKFKNGEVIYTEVPDGMEIFNKHIEGSGSGDAP